MRTDVELDRKSSHFTLYAMVLLAWMALGGDLVMNGTSAFIRETPASSLVPCAIQAHSKKVASANREAGPLQICVVRASRSQTPSHQNSQEETSLLSALVCGTLLPQPEQTEAIRGSLPGSGCP